jgi:hypothetical protein
MVSSRTADESTPRLSPEQAVAVVRELIDGDGLTPRFVLALEVLIECASAPASLAVRQDIDALKREQGTSRFVLGPAIGKTEVRYADGIKRALDVLCPHLERLLGEPPVADDGREAAAAGAYTRAQFAAAVDEAHGVLHRADGDDAELHQAGADPWERIDTLRAAMGEVHEHLHKVGAGLSRVDCGAPDPEAQRLVRGLIESGKREIPCGHRVEDLIGGTDPATGRPLVTKCGACLADRQSNGARS